MSRRSVRWARALMGAAVLAVVAWHSGAGGFIAGVQAVDARTLLAASALTFVATVCCASRWKLVASCLGVEVSLRTAIASYYRSQFLNMVLPGGVLGDVHRGLHHGHRVRNVSAGLRSVGWERVAGQAVQLGVVGLVLLALPSPVPWALPVAAAALAVGMGTGWVVLWRLGRRCLGRIAALSIVVSGCHVATFVVAARAVTPNIPVARLLPLACLVLLAAAVPANLGGWGPREGAAVWLFAAAGIGASRGVATATVFGIAVAVATLPGGVRLALDAVSGGLRARQQLAPGGSWLMRSRPYTLLSCGMSIDGFIDSAAVRRLALSNEADFDRVDAVRAGCDAIFVGAETVRNDNPRLLVRDPQRRQQRVARGKPPSPMKVTVTGSGALDPEAHFFRTGEQVDKIVYCSSAAARQARRRLDDVATVVELGRTVDVHCICADLHSRGVRRLMVEGGGSMHTQFLTADVVDELQLVVAPLFVGDSRSRRFVLDGAFPWNPHHRATLAEVLPIGDVVLLRYALSPYFCAQGGDAP